MSANRRRFRIALYATRTTRRMQKHRAVLYFGNDCDWSEIQRARNGNPSWSLLATAEETPDAAAYRKASPRAVSLQYSGKAPGDLAGLAADLASLAFDQATIARFIERARRFFPSGPAELTSHPIG